MRMNMRLTGFNELDRALGEMKKATAKNVLRRSAKPALEPMADRASALAPEDEGKLAFSIVVSEKGTRRADWARGLDRSTFVMAMGPASGVGALQYAAFVEFGTIDTPAFPYMRPAWQAEKHATLERLATNLRVEIKRAADRAARKTARRPGR